MTARRDRRAPLAVVVAAAAAAVLGSMAPAAASGAVDDVVTTTTAPALDVADAVADLTGDSTTSTTSTSSTSTSTTSTTSASKAASASTSTTSTSTTTTSTTTVIPVSPTTTAPTAVAEGAPATAEPAAVPVTTAAVTPTPAALLHDLPAALVTPTGPRSTLDVLALLSPRGATPQLIARILSPFPVVGAAHYSDDWGAPRHGPPAHRHEGTDIFAELGTPVIASADGVVSRMTTTGRLGGTSLRLTTTNGTFFYYAHLDRFVDGLANGDRVNGGDVVGFVGQTGNAAGTPPHLHYEIHPHGGAATSPIPFLDRWLVEARATASSIVVSPAVDAVFSLRPNVSPRVQLPPVERRAPEQLTMRSIDGERVSTAVDPLPLLTFFAVIGGMSWLAARGRKRARRRLRSRTQ